MANRRMIPTSFFRDPDILMLGKDAQLILIGLVLAADDYGRELAHAHLLGKQMGYTSKQMEVGLQELVANDLLVLYEVGRHRYYTLTRWWNWQTIALNRRVPSVHPLPPGMQKCDCDARAECPQGACVLHAPCGQDVCVVHASRQQNVAQKNLGEENLSKERGGEGKPLPPNVVSFPTAHADTANVTDTTFSDNEVEQATHQVASILKVPVDNALRRIVEDYARDTVLNFFGEADAAREWIEDPKRNQSRKRMSVAWFRTWLKREHDQALERQAKRQPSLTYQTTGLEGRGQRATPSVQGRTQPPSLMNLEQQYQAAATGTTGKDNAHE